MATNHASGNDRVPVQVGRVAGRAKKPDSTSEQTTANQKPTKDTGTPTNIRSGDARVGVQADVIVGDLVIRMGKRT